MASQTGKRLLDAGDQAPDIRLRDVDGKPRSLGEFLNQGSTLVVLFKVACPTCQFTLPFLQRLNGGRMPVVGISQDDAEWTREFQNEFGVKFPVLLDSEEDGYPVSNEFGIANVPSMFVVQPDRKISWSGLGFSRQAMVELSEMAGVRVIGQGETVPEWKAG
jgi:peroxiredoxin